MVLQTNNQGSETSKESRENKMNIVKWKDKIYDESVMYIWVYSNGLLISTNNRKSRAFIHKGIPNERPGYQDQYEEINFAKKNIDY
jgi:hypothetical protein